MTRRKKLNIDILFREYPFFYIIGLIFSAIILSIMAGTKEMFFGFIFVMIAIPCRKNLEELFKEYSLSYAFVVFIIACTIYIITANEEYVSFFLFVMIFTPLASNFTGILR